MSDLRKAFIKKQNNALKMAEVNNEFNCAIGNSKYAVIEIPDDIVECIDYGNATMTYREFIDRMNKELEAQK